MTFLIFGKKTFTFIQSFGRWTLIVVAASEFTRSMHFRFENDFSWKGGVASAAPQWICLVDRGAAQVLVQSINSRFGDGPEVSDLKKRTVPAGYQELRDAKYTCIRYIYTRIPHYWCNILMYIGTWNFIWIFIPFADKMLPYPRVPQDDCTRWCARDKTYEKLKKNAFYSLRLEYDPGQPRPPRVNAVTWHPDVGFLDEWSAHSAGKWRFLVTIYSGVFIFQVISVRGFWVMILSQGGAPDMRQEPSTKWTALILRVLTGEARIHVQCFCTGPMPLNDLWKCTYSMLCTAATLYRDLIWWEWAEDDAKAGEKETKVLYGSICRDDFLSLPVFLVEALTNLLNFLGLSRWLVTTKALWLYGRCMMKTLSSEFNKLKPSSATTLKSNPHSFCKLDRKSLMSFQAQPFCAYSCRLFMISSQTYTSSYERYVFHVSQNTKIRAGA